MAIRVASFLLLFLLGYSFSVAEQSCGGVLTNVSGVITSPNYPNDYPNGITCTWKISTETTHVNLTIEDFMLEDSQNCEEFDYVKISTKVRYRSEAVTVCGSMPSRELSLKVEGTAVEIKFKSDASFNARGFKISYRAYDVDPCLEKNGGCTHTCNLVKGKRVCSCPSGYKLKYDSQTCKDENSCYFVGYEKCPYHTRTFCKDLPDGTTTCECWNGYKEQNGKCVDIDECKEKPGRCGIGKCRNGRGWFSCDCPKGYRYDGTTCIDRNECKDYRKPDCGDATCVNTPGSFICQCAPGYQFNDTLSSCQDINECDINSGGCDHVCTNTNGSHICSCRPGYFLDSDGKTCRATRVEGLGRVRSSLTCQGASLDISCKDGQQALIIYKASYGRSRLGVCPYKNKQGVPENDTDDSSLCERVVTDNIKDLCGWHKRCNITVNSEALGEVCPGVYKYLTVLYSCGTPLMCQTLPPSGPCSTTEEDDCTSDESCHSSEMCCFNGCKRVCAVPSLYTADT